MQYNLNILKVVQVLSCKYCRILSFFLFSLNIPTDVSSETLSKKFLPVQ